MLLIIAIAIPRFNILVRERSVHKSNADPRARGRHRCFTKLGNNAIEIANHETRIALVGRDVRASDHAQWLFRPSDDEVGPPNELCQGTSVPDNVTGQDDRDLPASESQEVNHSLCRPSSRCANYVDTRE
ncbi:hypothetical protein ACL9RL_18465 [Plantibacter sp. Mn2098]|uniref:hypothetical protein n=1 Tax=Plantibacter sp. Mn2098 TaxID=3395266 RepID=UPI003BEDD6D5